MKSIRLCGGTSLWPAALVLGACAAGPADDGLVDDLPHLALLEEVRIGSLNDPEVGFSNISDVVAGDDGLLYVLERAEREVRVYDDDVLVRRFGRSGSGPGEFEVPTTLGLLGDTVWVADRRAQRLSLFRRDGTYIGGYSAPPVMIEPLPGISVMLRAGGLAQDGTLISSWAVLIPENPPTDTFLIPIVRMDTTGAVIDTVRRQKWAFPHRSTADVGGRTIPMPGAPEVNAIVTDAADGGTFTVDRPLATDAAVGEFTVTRTTAGGDTLYSRPFRYRPRPWSDAAIDSLIAGYDDLFETMGVDVEAGRAAARESIVLPEFQPAVRSAHAGRDGSLWLRSEDAASAEVRWLLLDPKGQARGVISTPRGTTLHEADGDIIWVEEPDKLDVPWLVRYRIDDVNMDEGD